MSHKKGKEKVWRRRIFVFCRRRRAHIKKEKEKTPASGTEIKPQQEQKKSQFFARPRSLKPLLCVFVRRVLPKLILNWTFFRHTLALKIDFVAPVSYHFQERMSRDLQIFVIFPIDAIIFIRWKIFSVCWWSNNKKK